MANTDYDSVACRKLIEYSERLRQSMDLTFLSHYGTDSSCEELRSDSNDLEPAPYHCALGICRAHALPFSNFFGSVRSSCTAENTLATLASVVDCRDGFSGQQTASDSLVLAIYLINQAKTGLSALALKRQRGSYPTAWLIHHKLMQAMGTREERYILDGTVHVDDAYLYGQHTGGKVGRGAENQISLNN